MAYEKALHLLNVAFEIGARHYGMSYAEMDTTFSDAPSAQARRRNTQRLVEKLQDLFGDQVSAEFDEDGQKRVFVRLEKLREIAGIKPEEMSALDRAIAALAAGGSPQDAENLKALATKIKLAMPAKGRTKFELDTEELIAGGQWIPRHGPSPKIEPSVWEPVTAALTGGSKLSFVYPNKDERRLVHPYGVITGYRSYLIARVEGASGDNPSRWRIDRMSDVRVEPGLSEKPAEFDLAAFAAKGFGAFYREEEYSEVEWLFAPDVAENALSYRFHPLQTATRNEDGSVTIRFSASGHLEMAWALYPWGDKVRVIKPEALARMVDGYQRNDFPGVP